LAEINHTRLRYIIASSESDAEAFINGLPFKVETKPFTQPSKGRGVVIWFVLPELPNLQFNSIDLRELN